MNAFPPHFTPNKEIHADESLPDGVSRHAACVEYAGDRYCGWQYQPHSPSVQAEVERALSAVANHSVQVVCAGRTDTGVHATGQVIHFDSFSNRPERGWLRGANSHLPGDIKLRWVKRVPAQFHARFSATARTYWYLIANSDQPPAIFGRGLTWERQPLDLACMQRAANFLVGEFDYSSFRAAGCQAASPVREITQVHFDQNNELIRFRVTANAFLYHMVRNLMGALIKVGRGHLDVDGFNALLQLQDRKAAPPTAPANGLYFISADYSSVFDLPRHSLGPHFLTMETGR